MTIKVARTIRPGDEVSFNYTGELSTVRKIIESENGKLFTFELIDDFGNFNLLTHKEVGLYKRGNM